ncbi:MAG: MerR family transcriptional regulator [Burkholderiaceae bacterium]|nr:MerR family transcriptional regulator [Burkholderiaceae bacterium]
MSAPHTPHLAQLLDEDTALTLDALARACRMDTHWVLARVQDGVLQADVDTEVGAVAENPEALRFTSTTVVRARRLAHLEITFNADPQLAALTADLIEEVLTLRRQLQHLSAQ